MIDPTPAQVQRLTQLADAGPVFMVNLLQFVQPGGEEGYARYGTAVQPCLEAVGARIVWGGMARALVIGDGEQAWWDMIAVVEYPSVAAIIQMVSSPEYQAIAHLRTESLARTELIATSLAQA